MNIKVIKFGGSSVADNKKLKMAAQKTISFLKEDTKVVCILSAQGNTTDKLIEEAKALSKSPNKRELDMLVSVGEQISCAKFAILLQEMGYSAISFTGWQAGIITNSEYTEAKISEIYQERIINALKTNQIVIIAGFQGIDEDDNITTLGRDGSDTTAVSIAAALNQKQCYIFTDTDGVYNKDPNLYEDAEKFEKLSYKEMSELVSNGAKVLHGRCIQIAEKYHVEIIVASSFEEKEGTIIS